jgi:hypothetical protein
VKPTALIRGSVTNVAPSPRPGMNSSENVPEGNPDALTAAVTARPTSSEVPGWASCALTTTGQPAASAEAVCGVRLGDDRAARRQRRRRVATGDAEGQREVAGAEHRDGAEGDGTLPDVRARQRRSLRLGRIDAGAVPATLAQHLGEQPQLAGGAADLACDALWR